MSQEAACAALFTLVSGVAVWNNTPARRLKLWGDVASESRPAFFQHEGGDDVYKWEAKPFPKRTIEPKLFFYFNASDAAPGAPQINAMLDTLNAALGAPPGLGSAAQTLGGTCSTAYIAGAFKDPGDLDGDAMLIVRVAIVLP